MVLVAIAVKLFVTAVKFYNSLFRYDNSSYKNTSDRWKIVESVTFYKF